MSQKNEQKPRIFGRFTKNLLLSSALLTGGCIAQPTTPPATVSDADAGQAAVIKREREIATAESHVWMWFETLKGETVHFKNPQDQREYERSLENFKKNFPKDLEKCEGAAHQIRNILNFENMNQEALYAAEEFVNAVNAYKQSLQATKKPEANPEKPRLFVGPKGAGASEKTGSPEGIAR